MGDHFFVSYIFGYNIFSIKVNCTNAFIMTYVCSTFFRCCDLNFILLENIGDAIVSYLESGHWKFSFCDISLLYKWRERIVYKFSKVVTVILFFFINNPYLNRKSPFEFMLYVVPICLVGHINRNRRMKMAIYWPIFTVFSPEKS